MWRNDEINAFARGTDFGCFFWSLPTLDFGKVSELNDFV